MKFVAVTSCPTGIAHSQMAAESLEKTANKLDHKIQVEIQGAMGAENELSRDTIVDANAALIAADTSVSQDRFEQTGVPVVKGTVKDAINDPESLFDRARETADRDECDTERTAEPNTTETVESQTESMENNARRDSETGSSNATLDADQIGGDPRKGLFARLKRILS
jgi:PTS system fructose-specific IIB component